ncbi:hypothetical protein LLG07_06085 [bacterium]|nr:hypothetical protein [bacterium]
MDKDRLSTFDKDKLIDMIIKKDEIIVNLAKRVEGQEYLGRLLIEDKWYNFYVRKDE